VPNLVFDTVDADQLLVFGESVLCFRLKVFATWVVFVKLVSSSVFESKLMDVIP